MAVYCCREASCPRLGSGDAWSTSGIVSVLEVDKIKIKNPSGTYDDIAGSGVVVLKGSKYTFKAYPSPSGISWPSGEPNWSGVASDTGSTIDVKFPNAGAPSLTARCALACDGGNTVTINVVAPEPNDVYFVDNVAGEEHDIYNVSDPVWKSVGSDDWPASYTMGKKIKVEAKFRSSDDLTYSTSVYVDTSGGGFTFGEDTSVTFHSWASEKTTHVSDNSLPGTIGSNSVTLTWKYKVPSGTDEWITMGTSGVHTIYRVYGDPECNSSEYTEGHLSKATSYASGGGPSDDDVCTTLQSYIYSHKNFQSSTGPDGENGVWNIIDPGGSNYQGDCVAHANLMKVCLKVLGIDASYGFVSDATNQPSEDAPVYTTYWCQTNGRTERRYFQEISGGSIWNFQGVCGVSGTYYDLTASTTSGTYDYCKTVGNGIVDELADIVYIDAGLDHSMAIDKYGQVWVWGYNHHGILGLGDENERKYATKQ